MLTFPGVTLFTVRVRTAEAVAMFFIETLTVGTVWLWYVVRLKEIV